VIFMGHKLKDLWAAFSYDVFYCTRNTFVCLLLRKLFLLYVIRVLNKELSSLVGTSDDFNISTKLSYWKIISDAIYFDFCKHHDS
jgi:hypothetical protein